MPAEISQDRSLPQHYRASKQIVDSGPLREMGQAGQCPVALAYWRVGEVEQVTHVNDAYPTILFHAAGGYVDSDRCNRFQATGRSWPGEAMLVPVEAEVNCRWREPVEYLHVYFCPGYVEGVALENDVHGLGELQERSHVRDPRLTGLFASLLKRPWNQSPDPLFLEGLAVDLATVTLLTFSAKSMNTLPSSANAMTPGRLRRVIDRVESSLHQTLSVKDLAAAAGLSPAYFTRAFRAEVGCSPYQFVMQRRVERAKRLMQKREISLRSIVDKAGFCNAGHFSNAFRQSTGVTPRQWQQML